MWSSGRAPNPVPVSHTHPVRVGGRRRHFSTRVFLQIFQSNGWFLDWNKNIQSGSLRVLAGLLEMCLFVQTRWSCTIIINSGPIREFRVNMELKVNREWTYSVRRFVKFESHSRQIVWIRIVRGACVNHSLPSFSKWWHGNTSNRVTFPYLIFYKYQNHPHAACCKILNKDTEQRRLSNRRVFRLFHLWNRIVHR